MLLRHAASALWALIRLPVLIILVTLEPVVAFGLGAFALLGILTAVFLELSGAMRHFHLALMVGMSVGCVLMIVVYQGLIRLMSN